MEVVTDPYGWWVEPFVENPFMQRALVAALLVALVTAIVGTWVVLRGMAFFGDALAHGVLPGIAIAFIVGISTTVGAFVAAAVVVAGVYVIRRASPLPADTGIGVLFVGMLALAVVVMSTEQASYVGDLNRFLFGSITGVSATDLWWQATAVGLVVGASVWLHRGFLVMTFDETLAQMLGLRPRGLHLALLGLITIAIVSSFQVVGNLLVFAFLIAPPATSVLVVRRVPLIMVTAVAISAISAVTGILVSFHHDTAAGATMALTSVVIFFVVLAATSVARSRTMTRTAAAMV